MDIPELLAFCVRQQASDLHLSAGLPPMLRLGGDIRRINLPVIEAAPLHAMLTALMDEQQRQTYEQALDCDFAFALPGLARFRVNAFHQTRGPAAVIRAIPHEVPSLAQLNAPAILSELSARRQGLILITGPTGSGKSSTLAAMVGHINHTRAAHIVTIEDPVEFVHHPDKSIVNQRHVGIHTQSFSSALRAALREDPDVILIGELRDADTIRLALSAAETGHMVLATLHTNSAAKSVDRIVDVFPGDEKDMVRAMLSESLCAVLSQILLKTRQVGKRVAAHEVLLATPAIRNLIRENKIAHMASVMQTSAAVGMHTLDQCLAELVRKNIITQDTARAAARSPEHFA